MALRAGTLRASLETIVKECDDLLAGRPPFPVKTAIGSARREAAALIAMLDAPPAIAAATRRPQRVARR